MMHTILIGYMGSGKSTVGKILAKEWRQSFVDTDTVIEEEQGRSISVIFEQEGEAFFRDLETDCLKRLLNRDEATVISVGGGLPMRAENRELLRQLGKVIYLRVKPETVCERLKADNTRPLLQTEDPGRRIKEMLEIRGPVYEQAADMVVDTDTIPVREVVREIVLKRTERELM